MGNFPKGLGRALQVGFFGNKFLRTSRNIYSKSNQADVCLISNFLSIKLLDTFFPKFLRLKTKIFGPLGAIFHNSPLFQHCFVVLMFANITPIYCSHLSRFGKIKPSLSSLAFSSPLFATNNKPCHTKANSVKLQQFQLKNS